MVIIQKIVDFLYIFQIVKHRILKYELIIICISSVSVVINVVINFFIHFTCQPQCLIPSFLQLLPQPVPHPLFQKVKLSHEESTKPDSLSWGRTKAVLPASRLRKTSHHRERAPKVNSSTSDSTWSHCQEFLKQKKIHNCWLNAEGLVQSHGDFPVV